MLLSEILRISSLPLKEEQGWAVCYSCAKILTDLIEKGIKITQLDESNLSFLENGSLEIVPSSSFNAVSHEIGEGELIESLGILLVKSLNYGLSPDHPLSISENFDSLLLHMTSTLSHDEGVAACSVLSFEDVLSACTGRISDDPQRCDSHYRSVCQKMVAEACELASFLDIIGNSNEREEKSLQRGDWARIWLSIMSELRHGVKLKHLEPESSKKTQEFELTPFEVLLADIRSQRYRLNPVMVNGDIPQSVRKSAETLILDYIKSRPPLKAAPVRTGKKFTRPPTARDLLLSAIRNNEFELKPVKIKSTSASNSHKVTNSNSSHHNSRRRVIRIDRSRISADSDPEDAADGSTDSSLQPTASSPSFVEVENVTENITSLTVNPQIKKLRTIAMTRSRSLSPPPDLRSRSDKLAKQQTFAENLLSPVESESDGFIQMEAPSASNKSPLTFDELARIRSVLTAAELEQLAVCPHVQSDVGSGRVCFACRKVRFNLIHWSIRCRLCSWNVCQKCTMPSVILPGFERGVPICCDCYELLEMINNPKSPASSMSPSESTVQQNASDESVSIVRRASNDQRCV